MVKERLFNVTCGINVSSSTTKNFVATRTVAIVAPDSDTAKDAALKMYQTWVAGRMEVERALSQTFYQAERPTETSLHWAEGLLPPPIEEAHDADT